MTTASQLSRRTAVETRVANELARALHSFDALRRDERSWRRGFSDALAGWPWNCPDGMVRESYLSGYSDGVQARTLMRLRQTGT